MAQKQDPGNGKDEETFISPIAHWPDAWKAKFQEVLWERLERAITDGWQITLGDGSFAVPSGDPKTIQYVINLLESTQHYVEHLMTRHN